MRSKAIRTEAGNVIPKGQLVSARRYPFFSHSGICYCFLHSKCDRSCLSTYEISFLSPRIVPFFSQGAIRPNLLSKHNGFPLKACENNKVGQMLIIHNMPFFVKRKTEYKNLSRRSPAPGFRDGVCAARGG